MGRIPIKGGVWNNTEDEILKASVMKHAKNDWARISSLLPRKSAKQCKGRWYEWLDPSIRKTEWTRQEDEKLLHLAKLMPTQWRTIAPIVRRTPSQCLERYENLLDSAYFEDENYEPGDDPRKLRPGEIDPTPESKPARPDSVDMDEYEKEMLSEARARLANTNGKKAKRKAREKLLEEARRLATLQKKRELIAAGIVVARRKRNLRGIDYNLEIPFEKRPPSGFFDVAEEEETSVIQPKFPTTIEELEGKRRIDVEAQIRRQDILKNEIARRPAILQANKWKDRQTVRKRSKFMLPPPQVTEDELEEIARMQCADIIAGSEELSEGIGATRALLANYAQTPLRTLQRTPGGKADAIMMEAENLAKLRDCHTPLLGGDNQELHLSDFSGATPMEREIQTPNLRSAIGDMVQRNEVMHKGSKLESRRNLLSSLGNLPHPQNKYEITIQQQHPEENDDEEARVQIEEDMSSRVGREKAEEEARKQAFLKKRSEKILRLLLRPPTASAELVRNSLKTSGEQADNIIQRELLLLLEHENADKEKTKKRKSTTPVREIEELDEYELREADSDIQEEVAHLGVAMEHINESLDVASHAERLDALRDQFEDVKSRMGDETKKAQRLEQKLKLLTHGYQERTADLLSQIEVAYSKIYTATIDLACFQDLRKQENLAASNRIHGLLGEIRKQKVLQEVLQKRYGNMLAQQERIQQALEQYQGKAL